LRQDGPAGWDGETIEPPNWLDGPAREHWTELAPILQSAGLLTAGERQSLALLCDALSRFQTGPGPPAGVYGPVILIEFFHDSENSLGDSVS